MHVTIKQRRKACSRTLKLLSNWHIVFLSFHHYFQVNTMQFTQSIILLPQLIMLSTKLSSLACVLTKVSYPELWVVWLPWRLQLHWQQYRYMYRCVSDWQQRLSECCWCKGGGCHSDGWRWRSVSETNQTPNQYQNRKLFRSKDTQVTSDLCVRVCPGEVVEVGGVTGQTSDLKLLSFQTD